MIRNCYQVIRVKILKQREEQKIFNSFKRELRWTGISDLPVFLCLLVDQLLQVGAPGAYDNFVCINDLRLIFVSLVLEDELEIAV